MRWREEGSGAETAEGSRVGGGLKREERDGVEEGGKKIKACEKKKERDQVGGLIIESDRTAGKFP